MQQVRTKTHLGWMLCGIGLAMAGQHGAADGCFIPSEAAWRQQRERSLINEPDQKALIYFANGQERLIISPSYAGSVSDFAWVVPVPSRPKVEVLQGAPFHELARLVEPRPPATRNRQEAGEMYKRAAPSVTVIERKTVGDYDVSVLESNDANALQNWLVRNHYHLPDGAVTPMRYYIAQRWTFVASRIKPRDSASGLRTGTLSPLSLTFAAQNPIYPMRLSSANPQAFNLLLYIAMPASQAGGRPTALLPELSGPRNGEMRYKATLAADAQQDFPTLARLSREPIYVCMMKTSLQPEESNRDYAWLAPARPAIVR